MKKALLLVLLGTFSLSFSQSELVFVEFKDKPNKAFFYANPTIELSKKSLDRRKALGIPLNDQDAPIEQSYLQNLISLGFVVKDYSKWLNGAAVTANAAQVELLKAQPFVKSIESFAQNSAVVSKKNKPNKWKLFNQENTAKMYNYGTSLDQIEQVNIKPLHLADFTGKGISIAVLDTGFPYVNTTFVYQNLRDHHQIKDTYDFVKKSNNVYDPSVNPHGAVVLGAIGGFIQDEFVGSAPDADFYLYATEDGTQEIPEEQMYWIEAAEEADRQGVDIITASLGYSEFDNPIYNYTYEDMNGRTTFISRGAQIAAEKGIFVLSAAGNSGDDDWHYLVAPSDNAKVFSVGAVDKDGDPSPFSSYGPNSDGIIKPDGCAKGSYTATVYKDGVIYSSGTSLSTPVAAGGVACLLQAVSQNYSREEIRKTLHETASLFGSPTSQEGYGILNFWQAYQQLKSSNSGTISFEVYPNPTKDYVFVRTEGRVQNVEIYDVLGRLIRSEKTHQYVFDFTDLQSGIYFLKLKISGQIHIKKVVKE